MTTASAIRLQIETTLAHKIPSALTPPPRIIRPVVETGIESLDALLEGGLPVGAVTELVGAECSGRISTALSFLARITQANKVCAWIDVMDGLDPLSAAAAGVDLARMLWVRCGVRPSDSTGKRTRFALPEKYFVAHAPKKGLHGGGFGPHPRTETKGLSDAIVGLVQGTPIIPKCSEPIHRPRPKQETFQPNIRVSIDTDRTTQRREPWNRITQALRCTDLILQSGGFSAIVLDMAGLPPEVVSRIELSTWHRYRVAAERTQSSILLLAQYPCAKSSSELQLRLLPAEDIHDEATVFTGIQTRVEVSRKRFAQPETNLVTLRKPPQRAATVCWHNRAPWAGAR